MFGGGGEERDSLGNCWSIITSMFYRELPPLLRIIVAAATALATPTPTATSISFSFYFFNKYLLEVPKCLLFLLFYTVCYLYYVGNKNPAPPFEAFSCPTKWMILVKNDNFGSFIYLIEVKFVLQAIDNFIFSQFFLCWKFFGGLFHPM